MKMLQLSIRFLKSEEAIQNSRKTKWLYLNNAIAFLKEQDADENTIRLIEEQCSANVTEEEAKEKQPTSGSAEVSQPIHGTIKGVGIDFQQGHALIIIK